MSSTSSSSRQPAFVGQDVFHDAANRLQKKPSTSSPTQASTSPSAVLDASTSALDKQATSSPEAAPWTAHCKHLGCSRPAKYREERDTMPIACQAHKRKGQYTINRKGELLVATRDGEAFRTSDLETSSTTAAVGCPHPASSEASDTAASAFPRPSTGKSGNGQMSSALSRRKQTAKISAPPAITFKGPKQSGISAEVDRRCLFPGCDARPGYGLPGAARAVYCFSHKKRSMVHVPKSPLNLYTRGSKRKIATSAAAAVEGKVQDKNWHKHTAEREAELTFIITAMKAAAATRSAKKRKNKTWPKPKVEGMAAKSPLDLNTRGSKRKIATSAAAAVEGKVKDQNWHKHTVEREAELTFIITAMKAAAATRLAKKRKNKTWPKPKAEGMAGEGGSGVGGERRMEISCAEEDNITGDLKPHERTDPKLELLSPSASLVMAQVASDEQASTTGTMNNSTQGNAATITPPPPRSTNRMAGTSGMTPSGEMLLLQQAREAAKKEAQASGRRPRAPSRRALEASGKMQGEGAQWMTREKRAQQARVMAELREQRKLNKEAGLRFGVVVEALMEPATAMSGDGDKAGDGDLGRVESARSDPDWQKVPAALLVAAPHLQPITPGAGDRPEKRARPNSTKTKLEL